MREQAPEPVAQRAPLAPGKAVEALRQWKAVWDTAKPELRKQLLRGLYEKITVNGYEFVSVKLASDALRMGMALALPEEVKVKPRRTTRMGRACPRGLEPPTFRSAT